MVKMGRPKGRKDSKPKGPQDYYPDGLKTCYLCKKIKALEEFGIRHKNGFPRAECKSCQYDSVRQNRYRRLFGLTVEEYERKFEEQHGLCAICRLPEPSGRKLSVDHNHETDQKRGLLCYQCNTSLGLLKEDIIRMQRMIDYVKFWEGAEKAKENEGF